MYIWRVSYLIMLYYIMILILFTGDLSRLLAGEITDMNELLKQTRNAQPYETWSISVVDGSQGM